MVSAVAASSELQARQSPDVFLALNDIEQARFLDIAVDAMTMETLHHIIGLAIETRQKWLIANHNLHSLYLLREGVHNESDIFSRFYKLAKWTHIDGMSMVFLARFFGYRVSRDHRIAYNYSLPHLLALGEKQGWRIFYLGSSAAVSADGLKSFRNKYPKLAIDTHHGYFVKEPCSPENDAVLKKIQDFQPNILFVGMGMPLQEQWIADNYDSLTTNVILTSGATLDYFTGALPRPPEWVGRIGLEWVYRLCNEPRRLGFRYLVEPWFILFSVLHQRMLRESGTRSD